MAARPPESLQEKLSRLSDAGERSDPLVFSGRRDEIKRIVRAAGNLPPAGARSQTFVIEGAPAATSAQELFGVSPTPRAGM